MLSELESLNRHIEGCEKKLTEALEMQRCDIAAGMPEVILLRHERNIARIRGQLEDLIKKRDKLNGK